MDAALISGHWTSTYKHMRTESLAWRSWPNTPVPSDFPIVVYTPGPHTPGLPIYTRPGLYLQQALRDHGGHWSRWRVLETPSTFVSRDPLQRNP